MIFWPFFKKQEDQAESVATPDCKHRWRMYGHTMIGAVTCERCGKEVGQNVALDKLLDEIQPK